MIILLGITDISRLSSTFYVLDIIGYLKTHDCPSAFL